MFHLELTKAKTNAASAAAVAGNLKCGRNCRLEAGT